MFWHGMPPELNTARLMAGAGAAPMLQAAAGWEALAIFLETQADVIALPPFRRPSNLRNDRGTAGFDAQDVVITLRLAMQHDAGYAVL